MLTVEVEVPLGEVWGRGEVVPHVDGAVLWRHHQFGDAMTRTPDEHLRLVGVGRMESVQR